VLTSKIVPFLFSPKTTSWEAELRIGNASDGLIVGNDVAGLCVGDGVGAGVGVEVGVATGALVTGAAVGANVL